jgi:DNA (cytosine-5)-methyltransferase 1
VRNLLVDPLRGAAEPVGPQWERSPLGLMVPARTPRHYDLPVAVDLFAGAGGFGCGFHQAGFHVAAASEVWIDAAMTYMCNLARPGVRIHFDTAERERDFSKAAAKQLGVEIDDDGNVTGPDPKANRPHHTREGMPIGAAGTGWISKQPAWHPGCEQFFLYDVKNLTGAVILDALGLEVGDVAVVTGGPPCQGFSGAGKRDVMDPRNSLIFEFARLICEIQPRTFVMENVPGLLSMVTPEGIPVIDAFALACADAGYGEYDALRRALGATRGSARAGTRKSRRPRKGKPVVDDPAPVPAAPQADAQLDLFDLAPADTRPHPLDGRP